MIEIREVGVRDGLQNESTILSTEEKLVLIYKLMAAGVKKIEVASFVNPNLMPQMADAEALIDMLPDGEDIEYSALVLSKSGLSRVLQTKIKHLQLSFAVTDGFNKKNINRTTEQSITEMIDIIGQAKTHNLTTNVILGTVFGCPYDGEVDLARVLQIATTLVEAGVDEITFADTIGVANPNAITTVVQQFKVRHGDFPLGLHLHNTYGRGLANALAGLQQGITRFDSSVGGIGGCPFAPRATGNICTEDLVSMLHAMDYQTPIDITSYIQAAKWVEGKLGRTLDGMVMRTI